MSLADSHATIAVVTAGNEARLAGTVPEPEAGNGEGRGHHEDRHADTRL